MRIYQLSSRKAPPKCSDIHMQHSRLRSDVSFLGRLLSYLHDEGIIFRESAEKILKNR